MVGIECQYHSSSALNINNREIWDYIHNLTASVILSTHFILFSHFKHEPPIQFTINTQVFHNFVLLNSNPCGFDLIYYCDIIGTLIEKSSNFWRCCRGLLIFQQGNICATFSFEFFIFIFIFLLLIVLLRYFLFMYVRVRIDVDTV